MRIGAVSLSHTRAQGAVGHSILVIAWHVLSDPDAVDDELGATPSPAAWTPGADKPAPSPSAKPSG
jgi:hypothetical protein